MRSDDRWNSGRAHAAVADAEVVFHLAARVGGIGFNLAHPALLIHDNMLLGAQIFEQSRLAGVDRLVAVCSVCAYAESPPVPFREDDLWEGYPEPSNAPYGIAKRVLVTLSEAYWRPPLAGDRSSPPGDRRVSNRDGAVTSSKSEPLISPSGRAARRN